MTDDDRDFIRRGVEKALRKMFERLEEEARTFLKMGYTLDELTIVQHDDGTQEVSPKSALS